MKTEIKKAEVEELLGAAITEGQFSEALEYAKRKQAYIYGRERRPVVLQPWYLIRLTAEYVGNLAFSRYTMSLCNMEKEHSVKDQSAQMDNHIVIHSV